MLHVVLFHPPLGKTVAKCFQLPSVCVHWPIDCMSTKDTIKVPNDMGSFSFWWMIGFSFFCRNKCDSQSIVMPASLLWLRKDDVQWVVGLWKRSSLSKFRLSTVRVLWNDVLSQKLIYISSPGWCRFLCGFLTWFFLLFWWPSQILMLTLLTGANLLMFYCRLS